LNKNFGDFLNSVESFLTAHPSETVLFRLKEEYEPEKVTRSLRKTLEYYLLKYKPNYLKTTLLSVSLGEARGKFIIFTDNTEFEGLGIKYNRAKIQDDYHLKTNWDLYEKWEKIKSHLEAAVDGDQSSFYINFLTGSGGSFPYFVASGHMSPQTSAARLSTGQLNIFSSNYPEFPRGSCVLGICSILFEGMNILTRNWVYYKNEKKYKRTVGIIVADFPGDSLIHVVINNNWILREPIDYLLVIPIEDDEINYQYIDYEQSGINYDYYSDLDFLDFLDFH
jgi:1-phosphatidylinositol phosphodiesterase